MAIHTTFGFVLPCRHCGEKILVGPTGPFAENTGRELTAYWHPGAKEGDKAVGLSEGSGDTFECLPCHVRILTESA